ncbi:MAG: UvrD-helicase domain-containing protein, partial [bacterium]
MSTQQSNLAAVDTAARQKALQTDKSFIVQAPAGSGKTELLIQRTMALLAQVEEPEEVVAITFTRKAAGEMLDRILKAMAEAKGPAPSEPHHKRTWELATKLVERNEQKGWGIFDNPSRLRIQTIDSLCASIVRRAPLATGFGVPPVPSEQAALLYHEAARNTLELLEAGIGFSEPVEKILIHLDNEFEKIAGLLADMLAVRDQWHRHIQTNSTPDQMRNILGANLKRIITTALGKLNSFIGKYNTQEIVRLADYAGQNVGGERMNQHVRKLAGIKKMPGCNSGDVDTWKNLSYLFITSSTQDWFTDRGVKISTGFPAGAPEKTNFLCLLASMRNDVDLLNQLIGVRALPDASYSDEQWATLEWMFKLLPDAENQLQQVFAGTGQVDFIEIAQRAVDALQSEGNDFTAGISHILVDEFQDTSYSQYALLEALTAKWQNGGGKTLFAVGDPMQSIYRFREAEVGLFLKAAQEKKIGNVSLDDPLVLHRNFRSHKKIVDWVNETFPKVLPDADDVRTGAVKFNASETVKGGGGVVELSLMPGRAREAKKVAEIAGCKKNRVDGTTAILVRSRSHLAEIIPELRRRNMKFRAVEIEKLADRPVVLALIALTRALLHPADRVSWLAVLRAPWCGLDLKDLHAIAGDDGSAATGSGNKYKTVWELINDNGMEARLTQDGWARLARIKSVLERALEQRGRIGLRRLVEGTWVALGGPACLRDETELAEAHECLDLIGELEEGGDMPDLQAFENSLDALFAPPDMDADNSLQVMTMHKAKGLEFDTVILPGLDRTTRSDKEGLLMWEEILGVGNSKNELILAPIPAAGKEKDNIRAYMTEIKNQKASNEAGRLLYVAATRARKELHLLGCFKMKKNPKPNESPYAKPTELSLLHKLATQNDMEYKAWVEEHKDKHEADQEQNKAAGVEPPKLRRLVKDWQLPESPDDMTATAAATESEEPAESALSPENNIYAVLQASPATKHAGTVVHRYLCRIAREGLPLWDKARIEKCKPAIEAMLRQLGVTQSNLEEAAARVIKALDFSVTDERGRWILSGERRDAHNEYRLSGIVNDKPVNGILDRTFKDEDGVLWVVDYKTSSHDGADKDAFIKSRIEKYRSQLDGYAGLIAAMNGLRDSADVRRMLFFPLLEDKAGCVW